jgi:hypothetical protein
MTKQSRTAQLGEVIAALFDEAARTSKDPRVVTRVATRALADLLRRAPVFPAVPLVPAHR